METFGTVSHIYKYQGGQVSLTGLSAGTSYTVSYLGLWLPACLADSSIVFTWYLVLSSRCHQHLDCQSAARKCVCVLGSCRKTAAKSKPKSAKQRAKPGQAAQHKVI